MPVAFAVLVVLALTAVLLHSAPAAAQAGTQTFRCTGDVGGVETNATLEIQPGGSWAGPFVAGLLQNQFAAYSFSGELFGGSEGYVSMVGLTTGERIDRIWIGLSRDGFALRLENGSQYAFACGV